MNACHSLNAHSFTCTGCVAEQRPIAASIIVRPFVLWRSIHTSVTSHTGVSPTRGSRPMNVRLLRNCAAGSVATTPPCRSARAPHSASVSAFLRAREQKLSAKLASSDYTMTGLPMYASGANTSRPAIYHLHVAGSEQYRNQVISSSVESNTHTGRDFPVMNEKLSPPQLADLSSARSSTRDARRLHRSSSYPRCHVASSPQAHWSSKGVTTGR